LSKRSFLVEQVVEDTGLVAEVPLDIVPQVVSTEEYREQHMIVASLGS
jgi:hypothetical protein